MVMVEVKDKKWYEDKKFLTNLNIYLDAVKNDDDDLVIVLAGPEGAGKSKRLRQIGAYAAHYLGTEFDPENIHFDLKEYIDFSIESPNNTVCALDEARNVLNRKNAMSKKNKKFTNYLSECRSKCQVHIIALPAYHDLDRYVVLWRMKFVMLIHKWFEEDNNRQSGYKIGRGKYTLYMNDDYLKDSYNYPYRYPRRWETKGEFPNFEVFDDKQLNEYIKKKGEGLEKKYHSKSEKEELTKTERKWRSRWTGLASNVLKDTHIKAEDIAEYCSMNVGTVRSNLGYSKNNFKY
jgi:hypothetical protein